MGLLELRRARRQAYQSPKTGGNAKSDAPDTWGTYDQALNHYEAQRGNGIAEITDP
jgi:hypothetical protein